MLEGDLVELTERRWKARLFEKHDNIRVAALVFYRDGEPVGDFGKPGLPPVRPPGSPTSCSTICAGPLPETSSGLGSRSASRWQ